MSADKPTAEKDDPNINGASWLELTEENLNAHKARMATLQGQKHEAKHEICNVTKKIISNAKKGESLTTSTCIHPEFIEHFEKKVLLSKIYPWESAPLSSGEFLSSN